MTRKRHTAGITLIEMLVCITVVGALASAVSVTYVAMLRYLKKENRQVQLLTDVQQAQRLVVQDVRCACALPDAYGSYDAGASTLICTVPVGETAGDAARGSHTVVYAIGGQDGRSLVRRVFDERNNVTPHSERILLEDVESLIFDRLPDGAPDTVRCTITVAEGRMHKSRPATYSFIAGKRYD
jgi:prepilin-type N-terminal cleavage/methylation domain-containing protein